MDEIKKHLPSKLKVKFQGILWSPFNSDITSDLKKRILEEANQGFVILLLQFGNKAELFQYVSKLNRVHERYTDTKLRPPKNQAKFNLIENTLVEKALHKRLDDNFYRENFVPSNDREGLYINFIYSETEYAALWLNNRQSILAATPGFKEKLEQSLEQSGIKGCFKIETI